MRLSACLVCLLIIALPSQANEAIRLRVSPEMPVEPAWITVRALIEPSPDNRALYLQVDSDTFFRSSQVEIEGEKAPRTNVFQYRDLPAGDYEVRVVLIGTNGRQRASATQSLMVVR